jgi:hypothetical protein
MKKIVFILLLAALSLPSGKMKADDNFSVWSSIGVDKKITDKLDANAEVEYRTRDSFKASERWAGYIGAGYRLFPFLKIDAGYTYIYKNTEHRTTNKGNYIPSFWSSRHRATVSVKGNVDWGNFNFSLRQGWRYTYRPRKSVAKYDGDNGSRKDDEIVESKKEHMFFTKPQIEYDIPNCIVTPYVSCELFYNHSGYDKTRYTAGAEIKVTKRHVFDVYYRYQDESDDDESSGNILGIGYVFKF